jgi:hypothetical protein
MEPILDYLERNLRAAGPKRWRAISAATGCPEHLIRKLAYRDRKNPGVGKVQPLVSFFQDVDRGARALPEPDSQKAAA